MARITADEVSDTLDTDLDPAAIKTWIGMANDLVDEIANTDSSISSGRLENIELLLTQHFCLVQKRRPESDTIGDSEYVYQGDTGMYFEATLYGQQALMLDQSDVLERKQSPKQEASVDVMDSRNIDRPDRD